MALVNKPKSIIGIGITNGTKVSIIHREINLGLTNHIVQAISEVLQNHKTIIVVEDDVALSNNFYTNMKSGLEILTSKGHLGLVGGFSPLNFSASTTRLRKLELLNE